MKRHIEHNLYKWFCKKRRKPLILRGARQVGKSTIVRQFAESNGLDLVEINLEKHQGLNKLFATKNIENICRELEFITNKDLSITKGKLLFLDEIQAVPEAISCLRYFYEDLPELAVISAGSLLEFSLSDHSFSMPVGRIEYLYMGPMNFVEYLEAFEQSKLVDLIKDFSWGNTFPQAAHEQLCSHLRDFLLVGGMPEAISNFLENKNFKDVIDVHLSIVETYHDDFAKYGKNSQLTLIQNIFQSVPQTVGNKIKYSNIDSMNQGRDIKKAIELLEKAKVITKVNHSNASGLPIGAGINPKIYKLYFLDVGLLNTMCGTKYLSLETLNDARFVNEGNIAEQFIAQHLLYTDCSNSRPELYYWLREGKSRNAEVDFIIPVENQIIPVEVKSGKSGTLKSLQQFVNQKDAKTCLRFDLNIPSKQTIEQKLTNSEEVKYDLVSLPIYMVCRPDLCINN
jgi:predicted AAA+ superfamily ATPase